MMKNKYSYILLLLLTTVGLTVSCSEFVISEYDKDDAAIYFVRTSSGDSLGHSFALVPGDDPDTVYLSVRTMGHLSDVDRPFAIKQTNSEDEDAAVPGVHYVPFDDEQMKPYFVMPANKATRSLPIIFLRDPSLESTTVKLALTVVENDYFRPGIDEWRDFLVTTTAELIKPYNWDFNWGGTFGEWGPVKMKFLIENSSISNWDAYLMDITYRAYLNQKIKEKLAEYNSTHDEPLQEADRTEVTFP